MWPHLSAGRSWKMAYRLWRTVVWRGLFSVREVNFTFPYNIFPFVKSTLPSHIIWWVRFDTESAHTLQRLIQPLYIATTRMTRIVLQRQLPHWPMMHLRGMRVDNCSKPTSCSIASRLMMPIICWAKESFWVLLYPSIIISSRRTTCKLVSLGAV